MFGLRFLMGDGAKSISKAARDTFSDCDDCEKSQRLMCWSHVHRALVPEIKKVSTFNKDVAKSLTQDIEDLQWACNDQNFQQLVKLLEEKYLNGGNYNAETLAALTRFFSYFQKEWIQSQEHRWFEGAHPHGSSNNQGVEGKNQSIKQSQTFRKKMPLASFFDMMLRMVNEWSLEDLSLLDGDRKDVLWTKPDGLKIRSDGYQWFMDHKSNQNYCEIKTANTNIKTTLENVSAIWAIPSSKSKLSELTLRELAKKRLVNRYSTLTTFDDHIKLRESCYLVERVEDEFYCDCLMGMKVRRFFNCIFIYYN